MTFTMLAVVVVAGLVGPLLAAPRSWHIPIVLGELLAGAVLGNTGLRYLHPADTTFSFIAAVGFALVMFVAGSHVPIRDRAIVSAARVGVLRAVLVGVVAAVLAVAIARWANTGHAALYTVLLASSSAALAFPILTSLKVSGPVVDALLVQVAFADAACIIALPLVVNPSRAGRTALGALAVIAAAFVIYLVLRQAEQSGVRRRLRRLSRSRRFALELRISLVLLFLLAALATSTGVSVMLAGFTLGLAVAAVGAPRRLARQLFAVTEGFFGPLFFVWFGARLDLRELGTHPHFVAVGVALGAGACLSHCAMRVLGQPLTLGLLAAGQLGVPVAAATIGTESGTLLPGEASALVLGALLTVAAGSLGAALYARKSAPAIAEQSGR